MGGHKKRRKNRKVGSWQDATLQNVIKTRKKRKQKPPITGFRDNYGRVLSADELIFPIVYHNEKTGIFHAIGTGYFVHPAGGFVTATHVLFDNNGAQLKPCYAVHTIGNQRLLREIIAFFPHPTADIGIGMLRGQLKKDNELHLLASFPISLTPPKVGDKIRTYAFPRSEVKVENDIQVGTFQGNWSVGEIKNLVKAGEHYLLKSDAYETNMHIASRASGGPVLRGTQVIGVNSTGWDFVEGEEPLSYITPIVEILDMEIHDSDGKKNTVRKLMESGHMPFAD